MKKEEVVIVGSGVGGATVAKELAGKGRSVKILEKGGYVEQPGTIYAGSIYANDESKEEIYIYRALAVGGSAMVSLANGVRSLEKELPALGINLEEEFKEAEKELQIIPVPEGHIGERTSRIMDASKKLGYNMQAMPKFIDFNKCKNCGLCVLGCPNEAKWTPLKYLEEAKSKGIEMLTGMTVEEILHSNGKVTGVRGAGQDGEFEISADIVILSAGGIETPIILQKSGISNAGLNFFVDLFNVTYGIIEDADMERELGMAAFHESSGFMLSPFIPSGATLIFRTPQTKEEKILKLKQTIGIMTKIKDDSQGKINIGGSMNKKPTENDQKKLDKGALIAKEILVKAGCNPESIFTTNPEGAHPGGTAAIGKVVNTDQETEMKGLFVSDASVLPESPGAPPILTIIALSKRLGKKLATKYFN